MVNSMHWPLPGGANYDDEKGGREEVSYRKNENAETRVVGTAQLYENGELRLIPMPTPDPKDPLNLPKWRKWVAIGSICVFGALALAAEVVITGLFPVFLLEYSGVDPHILNDVDFVARAAGSTLGLNPLSVVPEGVKPAPLDRVALLITVPLVSNGVASYFLVPLSIAIGRRPVLLLAAVCAWSGGLAAGFSNSLNSHIAARALQGLGAGAVEALIPLVVQDMVFIHQRNRAMAAVLSSQGIVLLSLGIGAPYLAAHYTWRYLYFITSGVGILAFVLLCIFVPETRWTRSKEELSGQKVWPLRPGQPRPDLDENTYGPRTRWTDLGLFQFGFEPRNAGVSMLHTLRTTIFPVIVWGVLANSVFIIAVQAAGQVTSFALLAQGWEFQHVGLANIPFFFASVMVYFFGGPLADKLSNAVTRWNGGNREPEHHLANLVFPFVSGVAGCFIYGWAGDNNIHWAVILLGFFLIIFGFVTTMTVLNVFVVESYPMWAGPVLVNLSSLRIIMAFFLASRATSWIAQRGLLWTFAIYAEVMIVLSLGIPVFFFFGKRLRKLTAGTVHGIRIEKVINSPSTV